MAGPRITRLKGKEDYTFQNMHSFLRLTHCRFSLGSSRVHPKSNLLILKEGQNAIPYFAIASGKNVIVKYQPCYFASGFPDFCEYSW